MYAWSPLSQLRQSKHGLAVAAWLAVATSSRSDTLQMIAPLGSKSGGPCVKRPESHRILGCILSTQHQ